MKPLVLIGGGGHCKSVIEVAESIELPILGVLDMPENVGKSILSTKIVGTDSEITAYVEKVDFVITVGFIKNSNIRVTLYEKVKSANGHLAHIIASTAHVSKYSKIGDGTVVMHHALVNANVQIAENVIINDFANIEHDVVIGAHSHVSTGVMVNGAVQIGQRCFIGSQSVIANGVHICDDVIIGAGSVVVKDIVKPGTYVGNPAKCLEKNG